MSKRRPLISVTWPRVPRVSDHGSEIILFGLIALGVIATLLYAVYRGLIDKLDVAAFLLVLQGIVSAVKERWTQRSVDRMGQQLGQSQPPTDGPMDVTVTNKPNEPVPTKDTEGM